MTMYGIYKRVGKKTAVRPLAVIKSRSARGAANAFSRRYRNPPENIRVYKVRIRKKRR